MEYVIEAANSDDMRSWLATIRYCMRSTPTVQVQGVEALTAMPNLTTIPASPPPNATAPTNSAEGMNYVVVSFNLCVILKEKFINFWKMDRHCIK